jgi:hypothetical protein
MTAAIVLVRNQIVTDLEALTPYDDTAMGYHYLRETEGRTFGDGAAFHRAFRLVWKGSENQHDFGALAIEEHRLELWVRQNSTDRASPATFDHHATEAMAIKRLINEREAWPTGTDYVYCLKVRPEPLPAPSENADLVFEILARTQEA